MDLETCIAMCRGLAKAYSTGVRLYEGEVPVFYYSASHMQPDPFAPYLRQIVDADGEAGIITTALHQFYGFLRLQGGQRVILGPIRAFHEDAKALLSAPAISPERFAWLLASLMTALQGKVFPLEKVWIKPKDSQKVPQCQEQPVVSHGEHGQPRHPQKSRFYRMCAQYVSENLFNTVRVEQMAQALGYTRAYLCTRFKQETGMPLTHYIQRVKIAEAKRLLQFTDQDLGQIAAMLDFSSQSHFQTVFRKITGETPMAYRRRTKITP